MAMRNGNAVPGTDTTKLGCGRELDDVWENITNPPDAHEVSCPDCQAARDNLADLHSATEQMISTDVADPKLRTDPAVLDDIIAIARAEVRRGQKIPLRRQAPGQLAGELTVSEQSIATVIRRVADATPEVEARRCHIKVADPTRSTGPAAVGNADQETDDPTAGLGPADNSATRLHIELSVAVTPNVAIADVMNALRTTIILSVAAEIGVEVATVDISVDDIVTADEVAHNSAEKQPDSEPQENPSA